MFGSGGINPTIPALSDDELRAYSFHRALRVAGGAEGGPSLEREVSDALSGPLGALRGQAQNGAFAIPTAAVFAALDSETAGEGAELVFTRPGTFVDALRARSVAATLGATILDDLPLPTAFPRMTGDVEMTWRGELAGVDDFEPPESHPSLPNLANTQPGFDRVRFALRTLAANVPYTRQLLAQTVGPRSIEQVVRTAAAAAIAAEWDRVSIDGTGAAGEPTGILKTTGVNTVAIGTNGGPPTYSTIVDLEHALSVDDADVARLGWASTPGVRKALRTMEKASGSGRFVWEGADILGHPARVSTNVPSDLTKGTGTNLHALLFGNWADLLIGMAPALDVVVDAFTRKKEGIAESTFFWYGDVQLGHVESFAAATDAVVN